MIIGHYMAGLGGVHTERAFGFAAVELRPPVRSLL
jgi:hypothetical protein